MAREVAGPTYVDVFGQQLVRHSVFVDDIVVHAGAGGRCSEQESEQSSIASQHDFLLRRRLLRKRAPSQDVISCTLRTHPPRKAPTGFLTGAGATTSCRNALLVWKPRTGTRWMLRAAVRAAGRKDRDAIRVNGALGRVGWLRATTMYSATHAVVYGMLWAGERQATLFVACG